jgi:multicomponent Na+:H+ antiporter subunit E
MIVNLILRLTIWFLLTCDLSLPNIIIGVAIALLLPNGRPSPERFKDWLRVLWETVVAVPQAYWESLQIMFRPHDHEEVIMQRVKPGRSPRLIFLDIFIITFTPKTIVLKYQERGWYEVHLVRRRQPR